MVPRTNRVRGPVERATWMRETLKELAHGTGVIGGSPIDITYNAGSREEDARLRSASGSRVLKMSCPREAMHSTDAPS